MGEVIKITEYSFNRIKHIQKDIENKIGIKISYYKIITKTFKDGNPEKIFSEINENNFDIYKFSLNKHSKGSIAVKVPKDIHSQISNYKSIVRENTKTTIYMKDIVDLMFMSDIPEKLFKLDSKHQ